MPQIELYKIDRVSHDVERLSNAVDKLCDRMEKFERDQLESYIKKKVTAFLFSIYPIVMTFLIYLVDVDHKKINDLFVQNGQSLYEMTSSVKEL
jgi:hypothetical protein